MNAITLRELPAADEPMGIERLRAVRGELATMDTDRLVPLIGQVEALGIAARAMHAEEIAREAVDTKMRAIRRFGEVLNACGGDAEYDALWDVLLTIVPSPPGINRCQELAKVPPRLFEKVLSDILSEGAYTCSVGRVVRRARLASLKAVQHGIWVSFDQTYFVGKKNAPREAHDLQHALDLVERPTDPASRALDDIYATVRRTSHSLSRMRLTGERARLVSRAELLLMEVAGLIDQAIAVKEKA